MNELLSYMKERAKELKKAITAAEREQKTFPEGRLRISFSNNRCRYYLMTERGDTQGEYLVKERRPLAKTLAQKDYNRVFLKTAKAELKSLEQSIKSYTKENADLAFQNLSEYRKHLVDPYILTDDLYAKAWQSQKFKSNPYMIEYKIYDTRKGEKVRSKSEVILADILLELGIPYHYEKQLKLKNGQSRYPDFTLLNVKTREEIYLEHFGLLDHEDYLGENLSKLDEYRKNGIYPGKNLLFTYETEDSPMDIMGIRKMLADLLL